MTYQYRCTKCGFVFDVIKSVRDMEVNEFCPECDNPAIREFVPQVLHISRAKVEHAEYNPAFGCVVKNRRHKEDLCKEHNMVEVGNDYGSSDKMVNSFDKAREEKRAADWEAL